VTGKSYRLEHARHSAAVELPPQHISDFQRLIRDLRYGSRTQLLIAEYMQVPYRDSLIARMDEVLTVDRLQSARLDVSDAGQADVAALESELYALARDHQAIHVTRGESWFDGKRWRALNLRRETVFERTPVRLILWLTPEPIARLSELAPNLWAWRAGIFSFASMPQVSREAPRPVSGPVDPRSLPERSRRISELRAFLAARPPLPEDLRLPLLDELADLHRSIGQLDEALRIGNEVIPVLKRLGDVRSLVFELQQMALLLLAPPDPDGSRRTDANAHLYRALADARRLRIPEAGTMERIMDEHGLSCPEESGAI
jgi:hypothetical protein